MPHALSPPLLAPPCLSLPLPLPLLSTPPLLQHSLSLSLSLSLAMAETDAKRAKREGAKTTFSRLSLFFPSFLRLLSAEATALAVCALYSEQRRGESRGQRDSEDKGGRERLSQLTPHVVVPSSSLSLSLSPPLSPLSSSAPLTHSPLSLSVPLPLSRTAHGLSHVAVCIPSCPRRTHPSTHSLTTRSPAFRPALSFSILRRSVSAASLSRPSSLFAGCFAIHRAFLSSRCCAWPQ